MGQSKEESEKQKKRAVDSPWSEQEGSDFWRAASAVCGIEVHCATRHDGGNRMLVDHLSDRVAQKDHVLIKRLDLALQLDAVDQVDRDGHMFAAQDVEEGVLQQLAFVF